VIRKSGHPFSVRDPAQQNNESAIAIKAIALPDKPPNQVSERKAGTQLSIQDEIFTGRRLPSRI
jgi:hypothetical protein